MNNLFLTLSIFFVANICLIRSGENASELKSVVVYFRHGDRTPGGSFPTDEFFKIENFPMGLSQLTSKGVKRHYELGKWFRNRYSTFLPERYSKNDILVLSTDVDRTLMSAEANLAGFYPPADNLVWNSNLLWRPIPVHPLPLEEDAVLAMKKDCPKFDQLYEYNLNATYYQKINELYADLYRNISEYSGLDVTDIEDIKMIRSIFYCYQSYNASFIPNWAWYLNQSDLDYLAGLAYSRYTFTDEMKRLRAGPFFDFLFDYFDDVIFDCTSVPKFLMLSSHDTEMASILDAIGVYDGYPVGFADTTIWEMKVDENGTDYINMFYKRDDDLISLIIPGCEENCYYEEFKKLLGSITVDPETWEKECLEEM